MRVRGHGKEVWVQTPGLVALGGIDGLGGEGGKVPCPRERRGSGIIKSYRRCDEAMFQREGEGCQEK